MLQYLLRKARHPFFLLVFVFLACEEQDIEANLGQSPPGSRFEVDTSDTFTTRLIQLRQMRQNIASSATNSAGVLNYGLQSTKIGAYRSSALGLVEYRLFVAPQEGNTQFSLPDDRPVDRAEVVLPQTENGDSARWGEASGSYTWTLQPLRRPVEGGYTTDTLFRISPAQEEEFFAPVELGRFEGSLANSSSANLLRIPLNKTGIDTFQSIVDRIQANNTGQLVTDLFNGFYLRMQDSERLAEGEGVIAEFNLQDPRAGVFFYVEDGQGNDSLVAELPFGDNTRRQIYSRIESEKTPADSALARRNLAENARGFLSPTPGYRINVSFPFLAQLRLQDTLLVHSAELFIPVDARTPMTDVPPLLLFSSGSDSARSNVNSYLPILSVSFNEDRQGYTLPITQRVQDLLEPNPNPNELASNSINLELSKGALFPVFLKPGNKASEGGVELRIVYSKLR